jgi:hypothetical protein
MKNKYFKKYSSSLHFSIIKKKSEDDGSMDEDTIIEM